MKEYLQENQFAIIGYGWATLVLTSLAYNFSQKRITMSQKVKIGEILTICSSSTRVWFHKLEHSLQS